MSDFKTCEGNNMKLEAYLYQRLESDDQVMFHSLVDSCTITPTINTWLDKVRATKCIYSVDVSTLDAEMEVILDPEKYCALKSQLVNPVLKVPKNERSHLAKMLNRRDCLIRVRI